MSDASVNKKMTTENNCTENCDNESSSLESISTSITNGQSHTSRSDTPTNVATAGGNVLFRNSISQVGRKNKKKKNLKSTPASNSTGKYSMVCSVKEDHGQPIFGCKFNNRLKEDEPLIFSTVGSNRVTIYECTSDGKLKLLQAYSDPDSEEIFYCCAWTDDGKKSLLAAGGSRGIIRIFCPASAQCVKHCLGHGNAINDLIFHPSDPNLLLSASKDHSLRLWNIKTNYLVAIFGGVEGHRDEVLAADIKVNGSYIVSGGMDHALKIWKLKKPEIEKAITLSYTYPVQSTRPFPTVKENFPEFSTRDIHRNYVDCTKWFGDFVVSKACENNVFFWKAGKVFQKWEDINFGIMETSVVTRLDISDCDIWFVRFTVDSTQTRLALGNSKGKTYVYDLSSDDPSQITYDVLLNPKCNRTIRQIAFSNDGNVLITVCDDATIWRWDLNKNFQHASQPLSSTNNAE